ncbi:MAG: hypothetical protein AB7L84_14690 [Acidimicrobiia bacterium]
MVGDDPDDDGPVPVLLPPEDRLWRHPSEMGRARSDALRRAVERRQAIELAAARAPAGPVEPVDAGWVEATGPAESHHA